MNYEISLRMQINEDNWLTMGDSHIIPWDMRDLISASSGLVMMNQATSGTADAIVPKLKKGIFELTEHQDIYRDYEIEHGLGSIKEILELYQHVLQDCQAHPYAEVYGCIVV